MDNCAPSTLLITKCQLDTYNYFVLINADNLIANVFHHHMNNHMNHQINHMMVHRFGATAHVGECFAQLNKLSYYVVTRHARVWVDRMIIYHVYNLMIHMIQILIFEHSE